MISQETIKAVILARGLGTRMKQSDDSADLDKSQVDVADTGLKALIPVGRPFLDYVLSSLADAGFRSVSLVIGPEHQAIREYYTRQSPPRRVEVSFSVQEKPLGTADAVAAAEAFVGRDSFLVINSDNYYPTAACQALRQLSDCGAALFEREALVRDSNIPAERVWKYAVARIGPDGCLRQIIEKPDDAVIQSLEQPIYISMNCWLFTPAIFNACRCIPPSARGELEITTAVQHLIDAQGERFHALRFEAGVLDLTSRADIASVQARLRGIEVNP